MSIEIISIIFLVVMFIIGAVFSINIGILGFVLSFLIMAFSGQITLDDIYSSFPADLFILLAGVTYLFAIVQNNGTVDLITGWGLRLLKGKIGLIPWVLFLLATVLTSIGTSVIPVCAVLAPIGLRLAFQYKINPMLMVIVIQSGVVAGSFSPLNIFGIIVNDAMASKEILFSPGMLYINILLFNLFIAILGYILLGGIRLLRNSQNAQALVAAAEEVPSKFESSAENRMTFYRGVTLAGLVLLIILVMGFQLNMGFVALTLGAVIALMDSKNQADVLKKMPWPTLLLVSGIVTYIGVLEQVGTIQYVTALIQEVGNPYLTSLVTTYIGGVTSAFASTTGLLGVIIPMAAPILTDPAVSSIGVVTAIALASSLVDLSPFTTGGALYLANVQGVPERVFFMKLLTVGGLFIVLSPIVAWLIFVVLGSAIL
ncbi:SLC13 family permease [Bacillus sp. X1(2014)]|uniref:SLC13 family permease n=1 Tax=Bacillus sp. X1(2014) TaxID=1565991 RepID=UPI0011A640FC|nr:SLC13 family permease [Bacillus sp. X1(2014)]